jgi:murein DD-endopeptidase MepM/ murein hydrolase activator NlpD
VSPSSLRAGGLRTGLAALVVGTAWVAPVPARAATQPPTLHTVAGTVLRPLPWRLPVTHYRLTGRFGDVSGLWSKVHTGLDFAAAYGTPIRAVAPGVVVSVGYDGAYGEKTVVRLADGTVLWYCHQSDTRVQVGQQVTAGQVIGAIGSTGNTTGPHLHLEVHEHGKPLDPFPALVAHGVRP